MTRLNARLKTLSELYPNSVATELTVRSVERRIRPADCIRQRTR